jgi:hypothetical protein
VDSAVFAVAVQPLELLQTTSLPCSRLGNPRYKYIPSPNLVVSFL